MYFWCSSCLLHGIVMNPRFCQKFLVNSSAQILQTSHPATLRTQVCWICTVARGIQCAREYRQFPWLRSGQVTAKERQSRKIIFYRNFIIFMSVFCWGFREVLDWVSSVWLRKFLIEEVFDWGSVWGPWVYRKLPVLLMMVPLIYKLPVFLMLLIHLKIVKSSY